MEFHCFNAFCGCKIVLCKGRARGSNLIPQDHARDAGLLCCPLSSLALQKKAAERHGEKCEVM